VPLAVADTLSGHVSFTFADFAVGLAQIKGGKMKSLGVTSLARTPLAPDIPAIAEELPGFETILWYGLVAPAGTPRNVVNRLHDAVNRRHHPARHQDAPRYHGTRRCAHEPGPVRGLHQKRNRQMVAGSEGSGHPAGMSA